VLYRATIPHRTNGTNHHHRSRRPLPLYTKSPISCQFFALLVFHPAVRFHLDVSVVCYLDALASFRRGKTGRTLLGTKVRAPLPALQKKGETLVMKKERRLIALPPAAKNPFEKGFLDFLKLLFGSSMSGSSSKSILSAVNHAFW